MIMTLVVVYNAAEKKVLLGMKKRGFGVGRWNGFGGKIDEGETVEQAAIRELKEEVGIEVDQLTPRGGLRFTFEKNDYHGKAGEDLEARLFSIDDYSGDPQETEEMRPQWFSYDEIPYDQMWADDKYWLPIFLEGKSIKGAVHFDEPGSQTILSNTIEGY